MKFEDLRRTSGRNVKTIIVNADLNELRVNKREPLGREAFDKYEVLDIYLFMNNPLQVQIDYNRTYRY